MDLNVDVVAPSGRDAELITLALRQQGIPAESTSIAEFVHKAEGDGALGPLLIAEEALSAAAIERLSGFVREQASWSDLPILILTGAGPETRESSRLRKDWLRLGSPILLERPMSGASLTSSVQAALLGRVRQYEMKDALAELKSEREVLQAMLDNLPVGVVLAKASGEIVRGNKRLEEIVRHPLLPSADIEAQGEWIAFHSDGRRVRGEEFPLARAMKLGHALPPEEYLYERGDGTRAWVQLAAAPILNEKNEVTGGVVALSDIDTQKKSETALIQSEKLAAVGRLASSISHEINNPLESVTNLLYLACHHESVDGEVKHFLELADQELRRVSEIVSHTLRFHRQSTKPRAITARELLESPLGLYAGRMNDAGVELVLQHTESPAVTCYEGEIRQVLNNLIGNAIESMRLGGKLTVRTRESQSWTTGQRGLRITVADTGSGIAPDVARHVFDAFYTTKGQNGTGLGLWIAKGIVEKHLGSLRLFSRVGAECSGTVFSLFLPSNPFSR